jgi:N-glycosylase/DNA lyase
MKYIINDEIDLHKIAHSGQCFRWRDLGNDSFLIPAFGKVVRVSQGKDLELSCTEEEFQSIWYQYFDLGRDYTSIRNMIDKNDCFLYNAGQAGKGIRILRQDPLETLISFIISQRKSIPAIKTSIEKLCRACGHLIGNFEGEEIYSFPDLNDLINADISKLEACSLGYRLPYILKTVEELGKDPGLLDEMKEMDDHALIQRLMEFYGVGIKVASCTGLFGFHRTNLFPEDVWIKRALQDNYKEGFPFEKYRPYNGIMQQYIFEYYRTTAGNQ